MSDEEAPPPDEPVRVVDRRWWARGSSETEGAGTEDSATPDTDRPGYVAELETRLAEQGERLQAVSARYTEASEEFARTRERLRREVERDVERVRRQILTSFLEVLDNLDRAIAAARAVDDDGDETAGSLLTGVELVRRQFLDALRGHGVSPMEAAGTPFDPERHDAVVTVPVDDDAQVDHVVEVVTTGYLVQDEVLRPAGVTVGVRAPEPTGDRAAAPGETAES